MKNSNQSEILTRENSKVLYGIAILLMLFHHLFKANNVIDGGYISILNNVLGFNVIMYVAWMGKLCVAFFAFVSGYGIASKLKEVNRYSKYITMTLRRLMKFYKKYWIVFFTFITVFLICGAIETNPVSWILNLIGIKFDYNGAWWYVRNYVLMVLTAPIIKIILDRFNNARIVFTLFTLICIALFVGYYIQIPILSPLSRSTTAIYMMIFADGYLHKRYSVFEYWESHNIVSNSRFASIVTLAVVICIRFFLAREAGYCIIDILIISPIIYSICKIFKTWNRIGGGYDIWEKKLHICGSYMVSFLRLSK